MQKLYPININIQGRRCLMVGGGGVALRKIKGLLEAGAGVHVVSPKILDEIKRLPVKVFERAFRESDVDSAALVIAATDDADVNARVAAAAQLLNVPVNVADQPGLCSFFMPAVVRRGPLVISVSTSGASPAMAKIIRKQLEEEYSDIYGDFIEIVGSFRERIIASVPDQRKRAELFEEIAADRMLSMMLVNGEQALKGTIEKMIESYAGGRS